MQLSKGLSVLAQSAHEKKNECRQRGNAFVSFMIMLQPNNTSLHWIIHFHILSPASALFHRHNNTHTFILQRVKISLQNNENQILTSLLLLAKQKQTCLHFWLISKNANKSTWKFTTQQHKSVELQIKYAFWLRKSFSVPFEIMVQSRPFSSEFLCFISSPCSYFSTFLSEQRRFICWNEFYQHFKSIWNKQFSQNARMFSKCLNNGKWEGEREGKICAKR